MKNCGLNQRLVRSVTKTSDDYNEKLIKIKLDSDDKSPLNKTIEIPFMAIAVRANFYQNSQYYPQVLLDKHATL